MLEKIAAADYGCNLRRHRRALEKIVGSGTVPDPIGGYPGEVLELIRWSEPDTPGWSPGGLGRNGHVMRTFSCTVLLLSGALPEGHQRHVDSEGDTLVQLISSVLRLGSEFSLPTADLVLSRLAEHPLGEADRPFFVLALLLMLRLGGIATPSRDQWSVLANWLDDAEVEARLASPSPDSGYWLLDINSYVKRGSWMVLAREAFGPDSPAGTELIAQRVAEWPPAV